MNPNDTDASAKKSEKLTPAEIKQRNLKSYGLRIKKFRLESGITVDQLADALGISKSSVRNWECGLTRPDPQYFFDLFRIFNVEPNEFFGVDGVGNMLTEQERTLVDFFRTLDAAGKDAILIFAEAMSKKRKSEA